MAKAKFFPLELIRYIHYTRSSTIQYANLQLKMAVCTQSQFFELVTRCGLWDSKMFSRDGFSLVWTQFCTTLQNRDCMPYAHFHHFLVSAAVSQHPEQINEVQVRLHPRSIFRRRLKESHEISQPPSASDQAGSSTQDYRNGIKPAPPPRGRTQCKIIPKALLTFLLDHVSCV